MVSINSFSKSVFSVLTHLEELMMLDNKPGNLSGLLAHHFLFSIGRDSKFKIDWQVSIPLDVWLSENRSDLDQAPLLATFGCLLLENLKSLDDANAVKVLNKFMEGVERLKPRQNIFTTPNSWILNSEVVLGISFGVFTAPGNQNVKMAQRCLRKWYCSQGTF